VGKTEENSVRKKGQNIIFTVFAFVILLTVVIGCSDSTEDPITEQDPVIDFVRLKSNWNLAVESYNRVEAKIIDPQGSENIDSVIIRISDDAGIRVLKDKLYDDGAFYNDDGDVIAGDGVFSNKYDARTHIGENVGAYHIEIQAFDKDGNFSKPSAESIHLGYSYETEFIAVQSPDTLISGIDAAYLYVALNHPQGLESIENVMFNLYEYNSAVLLASKNMFNDGDFNNTGDVAADDSVFSYKLDFSFAAGRKGLYHLEFSALDEFGTVTSSDKYPLFLENKVGRIRELNIPERMQRPTEPQTIVRELITADVDDDQGLSDIDSVYFYLKRPDGVLVNSGNPFNMVDNGKPFILGTWYENAGDVTANDGVYSLSIFFYNDAVRGDYELEFYVRDKAGNLSTVLIDSLEVY